MLAACHGLAIYLVHAGDFPTWARMRGAKPRHGNLFTAMKSYCAGSKPVWRLCLCAAHAFTRRVLGSRHVKGRTIFGLLPPVTMTYSATGPISTAIGTCDPLRNDVTLQVA